MSVQKARQGYKLVKSLFGKYEEIPEEWEIKTIDNVNIKVIDGDRGEEYPKEHEFSKSGYCLFLSAKNVTKSGFLFDECSFISKNKDEKLRKGRLSRRDIVITTRGTVGNIAYFDENIPYEVIRINSGMAILQNNNEIVLQDFFYHLLKSQYITKQLTLFAFGSAQPQLTISIINSLKLIIPKKIEEQQKIASILSNVDSLIDQTQKIIDQTIILKKGLMQKLLTRGIGHTKFKKVKSFFGKYEEIPENWEILQLSKLCEKENDIVAGPFGSNLVVDDYVESGVPIIRLQNIDRNQFIEKNIKFISIEKAKELNYHSYQPNDLVLAKLGDPIGKTCRIPESFPSGIVVADVVRIRTSPKKSDRDFVEYVLNSKICTKQFDMERIGTTRPRVNLEQIRNLVFPCPPKPEQQKISSILSNVDSQIQRQQEYKSEIETLKKGLMQKLLTGQIRVKV